MTVKAEPDLAGVKVPHYGEYLGMYESDHAEVIARLFRKDGRLRAYVSYQKDLETHHFVDDYTQDLKRISEQHKLSLEILQLAR